MQLFKGSLFTTALPLWLAAISTSGALSVNIGDHGGNACTVKANGHQKDDVPNIMKAFKRCGSGGTIIFPEDQSYWIASKLNPILNDVVIHWRGQWTVSDSAPSRHILSL